MTSKPLVGDAPVQPQTESKTISRKVRLAWLLAMCVVVIGLDQLSKAYAVNHWRDEVPQIFFNDLFRIQYAENHGAFLSLLGNAPENVRFVTLTVLNGIVLMGIGVSLLWSRKIQWVTFLSLALIVAGGIGNLIDRIRLGYVIDFLNVGIGSLRSGIFNIADIAISIAFCMMVPMLFVSDSAESNNQKLPDPDSNDEITSHSEHTTIVPTEIDNQ